VNDDVPARVYVVGVGPGDPELLTVRAARVVQACELILHPGPRDDAGFAREVVAPLLRPEQQVRGMALAMKRGADDGSVGYKRVAETMAEAARAGTSAAYLTEGDAMLFGSGSYVVEQLRECAPDVPLEVVPGVSALSAAAAKLGWALAQKEQILTVCPATYHADAIGAILDRGGPVCWLKAAGVLPRLIDELSRRGRLEQAAAVERIGRPDERIYRDLNRALEAGLSYFSLVLVR
jgi:precorrin-2/cobalt-factor-2 C20-methyltransferase